MILVLHYFVVILACIIGDWGFLNPCNIEVPHRREMQIKFHF